MFNCRFCTKEENRSRPPKTPAWTIYEYNDKEDPKRITGQQLVCYKHRKVESK